MEASERTQFTSLLTTFKGNLNVEELAKGAIVVFLGSNFEKPNSDERTVLLKDLRYFVKAPLQPTFDSLILNALGKSLNGNAMTTSTSAATSITTTTTVVKPKPNIDIVTGLPLPRPPKKRRASPSKDTMTSNGEHVKSILDSDDLSNSSIELESSTRPTTTGAGEESDEPSSPNDILHHSSSNKINNPANDSLQEYEANGSATGNGNEFNCKKKKTN